MARWDELPDNLKSRVISSKKALQKAFELAEKSGLEDLAMLEANRIKEERMVKEYAKIKRSDDVKRRIKENAPMRKALATMKPETAQQKTQALGRLPAGRMNKTEQAYANILQARKMAGEVIWWAFEPINIRLADKCYYRCDFMLMLAGGQIQCVEVKGGAGFRDDALVKIKVASEILPFQFIAMQLVKGQWVMREF